MLYSTLNKFIYMGIRQNGPFANKPGVHSSKERRVTPAEELLAMLRRGEKPLENVSEKVRCAVNDILQKLLGSEDSESAAWWLQVLNEKLKPLLLDLDPLEQGNFQ
ncbi:hypothetical protein IPG41_06965 [Candidatus Peregrinibacteria bacterium]|nr:MAG: hypothetical protein IPG41_06965 [Candidatus Peregrinibacteria bacterium]